MRFWRRRQFDRNGVVGISVAAYGRPDLLRVTLASLRCQTYENLRVAVVHDGPETLDIRAVYDTTTLGDNRFRLMHTPERMDRFGHNCRSFGWQSDHLAGCRYLGTTNGDNYYVPVYVEWLTERLELGADLVYCDMVHSHTHWDRVNGAVRRKQIDAGSWLARADRVLATPWDDFGFAGDWRFISSLAKICQRTERVGRCLFVHN